MHHYDIVLTKVKPFLNSLEQNAANIASEWYSPVHQDVFRSFDLSCLNSNHRAAVKYSLREYDKEITNVANGVNIFAKQNIKLLKHIQATYFACPSQGHFVEGGEKMRVSRVRQVQRSNNGTIWQSSGHTLFMLLTLCQKARKKTSRKLSTNKRQVAKNLHQPFLTSTKSITDELRI